MPSAGQDLAGAGSGAVAGLTAGAAFGPIGAGVGAAAGAIVGFLSSLFGSGGDKDAAIAALQQMQLGYPVDLAKFSAQGATELSKIDPAQRQSEMQNLDTLMGKIAGGGYDSADYAAGTLANIQGELGASRSNAGLIQHLQSMGANPDQIAAAVASSGQGTAEGLTQNALGITQGAQARQLSEIQSAVGTAGQIWGQDAAVASAQDAINRFNAAGQTQVSEFNAGQTNAEQLAAMQAKNQEQLGIANVDMGSTANSPNAATAGAAVGGGPIVKGLTGGGSTPDSTGGAQSGVGPTTDTSGVGIGPTPSATPNYGVPTSPSGNIPTNQVAAPTPAYSTTASMPNATGASGSDPWAGYYSGNNGPITGSGAYGYFGANGSGN